MNWIQPGRFPTTDRRTSLANLACRIYGGGTTEETLAKLDLSKCKIDTKVWPLAPGDHRPEGIRKSVNESLAHFRPHGIKIRILYLHKPDAATPFEETLAEINKLHQEGLM